MTFSKPHPFRNTQFFKWLDAMQTCRDAKSCVSTIQQKTTFLKLDVVYKSLKKSFSLCRSASFACNARQTLTSKLYFDKSKTLQPLHFPLNLRFVLTLFCVAKTQKMASLRFWKKRVFLCEDDFKCLKATIFKGNTCV